MKLSAYEAYKAMMSGKKCRKVNDPKDLYYWIAHDCCWFRYQNGPAQMIEITFAYNEVWEIYDET